MRKFGGLLLKSVLISAVHEPGLVMRALSSTGDTERK